MATKDLYTNDQANESVSKYKLLSAYGGPGSIVHTQYGSIIISCIEEWGFLNKVLEIAKEAANEAENNTDEKILNYVFKQARLERNGRIGISNDIRLLESLKDRKQLVNLKYLTLVPDIEIKDFGNKIKEGLELTVASTFMPKTFADIQNNYRSYNEWFNDFSEVNKETDNQGRTKKKDFNFFPPKKNWNIEGDTKTIRKWYENLTQDNIVLICELGHISDFPWSQFLRWRNDSPLGIHDDNVVDLFSYQQCCKSPKMKISSSTSNSSGFDGKWLMCGNNCKTKGVSLKGLMSVKIKCPGHKPWEAKTIENKDYPYSGIGNLRNQSPLLETCSATEIKKGESKPKPMTVALTTGNNLYYSRIFSSIYMSRDLFKDDITLEIEKLEIKIDTFKKRYEEARSNGEKDEEKFYDEKWQKAVEELKAIEEHIEPKEIIIDSEKETKYRFQEFKALSQKSDKEINKEEKHLKVKNVTEHLNYENLDLTKYFKRVLRIDNMKITSAQLDFSRVVPADADAEGFSSKNIFKSSPELVNVYPVVENFGEGILIAFNETEIDDFGSSKSGKILISKINKNLENLKKHSNQFNIKAIEKAELMNWQLYLVHSFTHLIMRELEFRCGYPTASLQERIYVSNDPKYKMYGCMVYTSEGAEGSMGGLIAQTRPNNLNKLIKSALKRATICNSDPLCWESEGQGLFDLNFASCFSCSLVSETSCEHRNIYLDRRILVDEENGFFKDIIK